jgi:hypothetical protein
VAGREGWEVFGLDRSRRHRLLLQDPRPARAASLITIYSAPGGREAVCRQRHVLSSEDADDAMADEAESLIDPVRATPIACGAARGDDWQSFTDPMRWRACRRRRRYRDREL